MYMVFSSGPSMEYTFLLILGMVRTMNEICSPRLPEELALGVSSWSSTLFSGENGASLEPLLAHEHCSPSLYHAAVSPRGRVCVLPAKKEGIPSGVLGGPVACDC